MKLAITCVLLALLGACANREDVLEAEVARQAECDRMRQDLKDAEGRPLIHATLQENYNRQCIDVYPGPP